MAILRPETEHSFSGAIETIDPLSTNGKVRSAMLGLISNYGESAMFIQGITQSVLLMIMAAKRNMWSMREFLRLW
jgi:hypothetical protein